ncbi:MAG: DUF3175 domain-containing protein [Vulcanimicrobiaceae bacterium]
MKRSDALDIEEGAFAQRSAINRSGRNLPESRKRTLERAKNELRALYGREPKKNPRR